MFLSLRALALRQLISPLRLIRTIPASPKIKRGVEINWLDVL
jgi:hypothetical protein